MPAKFLNVDLEIESASRPSSIEKEFSIQCGSNLFSGEIEDNYLSTFELHVAPENDNPDGLISEFCALILTFGDDAKREWTDACKRVFDIGFEATDTEQRIDSILKEETVKAVAAIGASINITIYPPHDEGESS